MKGLIYELKILWLEIQYAHRLAKVSRDRFKNCKRGMMFEQRRVVHDWAAARRVEIYQSVYGE